MRTIAWDVDNVLNDLMGTWLSQAWLPAIPIVGFAMTGCRKIHRMRCLA